MNVFFFGGRASNQSTLVTIVCVYRTILQRDSFAVQSIGLARDDLIPTNGLITFDYVINTRYITYSICLYSSYSLWKKSLNLQFIFCSICWPSTLWPMGNDELILFPSSNVMIRFEVQHSNCLSKSHSLSKHQTPVIAIRYAEKMFFFLLLLILQQINRDRLRCCLCNLVGLFVFT